MITKKLFTALLAAILITGSFLPQKTHADVNNIKFTMIIALAAASAVTGLYMIAQEKNSYTSKMFSSIAGICLLVTGAAGIIYSDQLSQGPIE